MHMNECLFCKIVVGTIPNYTVYEDENVLAFLDIHPCSKGHTVVIPKKHFNNVQEMSSGEWLSLMTGVRLAMEKVQNTLNPGGLNMGINDRPVAGQAVGHVHWHIIPRYVGDGGGSMHSIVRSKKSEAVEEVAKLFFR